MKRTVGLVLLLMGCVSLTQAKEIQLVLNADTQYPMNIHYQVSSGGTVFGQGDLLIQPNDQTYHVAVNEIPDTDPVLVQIDKMTVANVTEIGDPCELALPQADLTANITIGFTGNPPPQHGRFMCSVSASS